MKRIFLLSILFFLAAAAYCQQKTTTTDFQQLNWLSGTWKRIQLKPGKSGHERWEQTSPASLKGIGITQRGTDTTFMEKLALVVKNGAIYYVADVAENKEPIYFKVSAISSTGFTCENAEHDFPKKIVYSRTDNRLKVTTSGGEKSIDFFFERE
ncbi:DUF6265 family protein [Chitinophaga flava]|uniref:DUF6265 domain-containing protein n=1 Tax=Chitinophaga flava TaxID=2259036 RepID=A0A365Y019_9BACT|nr:DUF6265 family protein [Chitinophaga flava]RBL91943.1 hypothetical protein DF182_04905 [Chitinophaga flava]